MPLDDLSSDLVAKIHRAVAHWEPVARGTCSISDCPNDVHSKNLCNAHYIRQRKGKDLTFPLPHPRPLTKGERAQRIKAALIEALGGKCQRCLQVYPTVVYDFHHIGPKTSNVGDLINNASVSEVVAELANCVLLCANCHRITEYGS